MEDWITKTILGAIGLLITYFIKSLLDNLKRVSRMESKVDLLSESLRKIEYLIEKLQATFVDYEIFKSTHDMELDVLRKRMESLEKQCEKCKEINMELDVLKKRMESLEKQCEKCKESK